MANVESDFSADHADSTELLSQSSHSQQGPTKKEWFGPKRRILRFSEDQLCCDVIEIGRSERPSRLEKAFGRIGMVTGDNERDGAFVQRGLDLQTWLDNVRFFS
jgi:hypothetical protein